MDVCDVDPGPASALAGAFALARLLLAADAVCRDGLNPVLVAVIVPTPLARALPADPPILIVDEPDEHLDAATADRITTALLGRSGTRTVGLITHRPPASGVD